MNRIIDNTSKVIGQTAFLSAMVILQYATNPMTLDILLLVEGLDATD